MWPYGSLEMNRFRRARSHSLPAQGCSTDIPVRRSTKIGSFPAHKEGGLKPQTLKIRVFCFSLPPFKPSAKWCSDQGEMAWMPFQAHPCRERVWVDPDMGAILPIKGLVRGGIFSFLFVAVDKKGLAHLLNRNYEVSIDFVCETLIRYLYSNCQQTICRRR